MAVDYNKNRQPVLSRFYLDDLNSKGVIVWVAPVIECKSHRLCPINALFSNIVIGQTEPDLECIHTRILITIKSTDKMTPDIQ